MADLFALYDSFTFSTAEAQVNFAEIAALATVVSMLVGIGVSYGLTKGIINGLRSMVAANEKEIEKLRIGRHYHSNCIANLQARMMRVDGLELPERDV